MFQAHHQKDQLTPPQTNALFTRLARVKQEIETLDPPSSDSDRTQLEALEQTYQQIRDQLVEANLGLVKWVINKYYYEDEGSSITQEDMVQEGVIGLIKAIEKFDLSYGNRFSSYARSWIQHTVSRVLEEKAAGIRLPAEWIRDRRLLARAGEVNAASVDPDSMEALSGWSEQRRKQVEQAPLLFYNLDQPARDSDQEQCQIENIPSPWKGPEEQVIQAEENQQTQALLNRLTPREIEIIQLRFGLAGLVETSSARIGQQLGLSRQRVRQLESNALTKLRRVAN